MKSEEGNKETFSHWSRLDTLFATQAWNLLWRLPEAKRSRFESEMFEVCVFHRLKGCFCELIENNRKVPLWKIPGTFWTIPVETGVTYEGLNSVQYGDLLGPKCQQW